MKWENFWEAAERRESVCEGSSGLGREGLLLLLLLCVAAEEGGPSGGTGDGDGDDEVWASLELAFWSEGGGGGGEGGGGWWVE
jgi:hypothetical protein